MGAAEANIIDLLRQAAERQPESCALVQGSGPRARRVSYAELWRRVDACAAGLSACGLVPDDRVVIMIPMSIDLYVALLGVIKAGAVAVFVDPWIRPRQIALFCRHAEPRAFIGVTRSHLLRLLEPRLLAIRLTVTTGTRLGPLPARWTLAEVEAHGRGGASIHPRRPDDAALITFTSGSSGEPKGANRTHGFLRAQRDALAGAFGAPPGAVDMPLFPVFALNNLAGGVCSVIPDLDFRHLERLDAARILSQLEEQRAQSLTASPALLDRLAAHLLSGRGPVPDLRRVLTGGAPVSDEQLDNWRRAFSGTALQVVYGSTEAEPVAHITLEERLALTGRPGICMGRPVPGLRARILRLAPPGSGERGGLADEAHAGEVGELVVSGAHVCRDYFRNPDATARDKLRESEGSVWHRMGDTGWMDEEGRFWLAGRVHTTIFRDGVPLHAQLVEAQAREALGAGAIAALGVRDPALGEQLVLVMHPSGPAPAAGEALERLRSAGLPVDRFIMSRRPLPMDPRHNSKVDYTALRKSLGLPAR